LAIETTKGDVLGSFTSSPWRARGTHFYGSGESFVWRLQQSRFTKPPCQTIEERIALEKNIEVFRWTGKNRNVQYLRHDDADIILGGGPPDNQEENLSTSNNWGFALTILSDLTRGTTGYSVTFDNPPLLTSHTKGNNDVFEIANLEVWTLSPVDNVDQAEKIELSRQFIFDHGNFVEA
jgi:hypothetical protein